MHSAPECRCNVQATDLAGMYNVKAARRLTHVLTNISRSNRPYIKRYRAIHCSCLYILRAFSFYLKTEKIPRSEEQGNDLESLDFPGKISAWRTEAHDGQPSGRTLFWRSPFLLLFHNDFRLHIHSFCCMLYTPACSLRMWRTGHFYVSPSIYHLNAIREAFNAQPVLCLPRLVGDGLPFFF